MRPFYGAICVRSRSLAGSSGAARGASLRVDDGPYRHWQPRGHTALARSIIDSLKTGDELEERETDE